MTSARPPKTVLVQRHGLVTRITHGINLLVVIGLLMSGLQIFNAHPALYWGHKSTFTQPWLAIQALDQGDGMAGSTWINGHGFETTGVLGYSGAPGAGEKRAFPKWATLPSYRSLGTGRHWHFFLAWIFVGNGLVYLASGLITGHVRRDLLPTRRELGLRQILQTVWDHLRLRFPRGEAARSYNVLQKLAYLAVAFILLPLMVLAGLGMSPGVDAGLPGLVSLFGGRQSARSIHFICASLIVGFIGLHVLMVLLSGPLNQLRGMITGKFRLEVREDG